VVRAADDVAAADEEAAVEAARAAVVPAAGVTRGTPVVCGELLAENGVHPARASTSRAMPLRVRRIHPE
jgi:hypothetical protein